MPSSPEFSLTLYYNFACPFVHRVLTSLHELSIPYKGVYIDLETPREEWYLKINPRGTVPALAFSSPAYNNGKETIINESLVIVNFISDLVPGALSPAATEPWAAVERARIGFFIDAYEKQIGAALRKVMFASVSSEEAVNAAADEAVAAVEKELEPLLEKQEGDGDGVFFGGKDRFTLAEIVAAPFLLRNFSLADAGVLPISLKDRLLALPNFGKWVQAVVKNESLLKDYDEPAIVEKTKVRLQQYKEGTFKPKV